jgi:hypothetical protein
MNEKKPIRTIVDKEDGKIVGFACANCGTFYSTISGEDEARKNAERCHNATATCFSCGGPVMSLHQKECDTCWQKEIGRTTAKAAELERGRFERAPKIKFSDYKGEYLFFPDFSIGHDGFLPVDGLEDYFADDDEKMPAYAWACSSFGLIMDAQLILDSALEDHHEDAGENVGAEDLNELQTLLDAWCAKQSVTSYQPTDEVVLLDELNSTEGVAVT